MQSLTKKMSGSNRRLLVVSVVFFGFFYLFLWLWIEPRFIYHYFEISRQRPFFRTGWVFLRDCLSYPGGPGLYLAAFLTQLCYFSWLGALCITLIAWAIYRLTFSLVAVAADSFWRIICYIPALLMLMICGRYEIPLCTGVVVLIVALFSVAYEKFSRHLGRTRVILFLLLCGILYYIVGGAALVFVALAALGEFFKRDECFFCLLFLFLGLAVCWLLGTCLFELEIGEAYLNSSPFIPTSQNLQKETWARVFEGALFVILPVVVLLINSARRSDVSLGTFQPHRGRKDKLSAGEVTSYELYHGRLKWVTQLMLLFLISVPSVFFSVDLKVKRVVQISYYTCRKMWPEVLDTARRGPLKRYFPFCCHAVNRALYYTGRLGDQMFTYPQDYRNTGMVFSATQGANAVFMERAEMCLELGMVNVAEKVAHEFLESSDDSPFILRQFALINVIKGQIETARVFLKALSENLIHSRQANELLRLLERDPQLEFDEQIQYLRSIMITEDDAYKDYIEGDWLEALLRRNRYNKMAFEYLMAHYLLTRQLDKFVENLSRLDDFGYESIPRHYQEAILLYIGTTQKEVDLGDRGINSETMEQYNEINKIGERFNVNRNAMFKLLAPGFGKTYFFYYAFGASGVRQ